MMREEAMNAKPDPTAFAEPPRDPAKLEDVEAALRQVLRAPVRSADKKRKPRASDGGTKSTVGPNLARLGRRQLASAWRKGVSRHD